MMRRTTEETASPLKKRTVGRDRAQEYAIASTARWSTFKIVRDRIPDVLGQRQANFMARLARHPQRTHLPLDIDEMELRHVAGPQTEANQKQHDGKFPPARAGVTIASSNQPADLFAR